MNFKRFAERLTKINNFHPLFPGLDVSKKTTQKYINKILLCVVPNVWAKQSYLQGWYFEVKIYKETCAVFERMEIAEQVYKGVTPSKTPTRAEANRGGHTRKLKGGEATSPTNPEKGCTGKRKTKNAGNLSDAPTRDKMTRLRHGPIHTSEECKVLKIYSKKYTKRRPHQSKEARSGGKPKRGKTVKFNKNTQ